MNAVHAATRGAPFVIFRSVNRDGETFALEPRSLERLRAEFGSAVHARPRIFLAHEARPDHERALGSVAPQIILLLTGLSEETLRAVGGFTFRDPVTDRDLPLSSS